LSKKARFENEDLAGRYCPEVIRKREFSVEESFGLGRRLQSSPASGLTTFSILLLQV
jgi:hypothetical protein